MGTFLSVLFIIICLLLIGMVLLQKGRGGGLGAAFGGAGSSAFGTRTGDVFTWVTIVLTALFLILAILTTVITRPEPTTVATPQFRPTPRPIAEAINVEIISATPGAAVHYTTDSAEPTRQSLQYETSAVRVTPGTVLRARAFRSGHKPSTIKTAEYPPVAPATAPTPGPTEGTPSMVPTTTPATE